MHERGKLKSHVVDFDDFGDEFGHDGLIGNLEGVYELDTTVYILDILAFEKSTARQLKARTLVRAATAAVPVLAYGVDAHAGLEALGETARRAPLAVE